MNKCKIKPQYPRSDVEYEYFTFNDIATTAINNYKDISGRIGSFFYYGFFLQKQEDIFAFKIQKQGNYVVNSIFKEGMVFVYNKDSYYLISESEFEKTYEILDFRPRVEILFIPSKAIIEIDNLNNVSDIRILDMLKSAMQPFARRLTEEYKEHRLIQDDSAVDPEDFEKYCQYLRDLDL